MKKKIAFRIAGKDFDIVLEILIRPGATPKTILRKLKCPDYALFLPSTGRMFLDEEDIFPLVKDEGEEIVAVRMNCYEFPLPDD